MKRFWDKVKKTKKCWEWTASMAGGGYGTFQIGTNRNRKTIPAHRFSWLIKNGPIPPGVFICHKCDNRKCVRPSHLFLGTPKDNMVDKMKKNRAWIKLSFKQVSDIRNEFALGYVTKSYLAKKYGVHRETIYRIIEFKNRVNH